MSMTQISIVMMWLHYYYWKIWNVMEEYRDWQSFLSPLYTRETWMLSTLKRGSRSEQRAIMTWKVSAPRAKLNGTLCFLSDVNRLSLTCFLKSICSLLIWTHKDIKSPTFGWIIAFSNHLYSKAHAFKVSFLHRWVAFLVIRQFIWSCMLIPPPCICCEQQCQVTSLNRRYPWIIKPDPERNKSRNCKMVCS